jgi:prepilin-type processing-associated H-X9-DG protein
MMTRLAKTNQGLTFTEVVTIIVVIWLGAFLLLPAFRSPNKSRRNDINCVSNLKQTALATLIWSHDNEKGFPWEVPITRTDRLEVVSGTLDWISSPEVFRHFRILSNELVTSKLLICPADKQRIIHDDFSTLSNRNLSYFVNISARFASSPSAVLFGDRNVMGGTLSSGFIRTYSSAKQLGWTKEVHQSSGNIAFVDGSASQIANWGLDDVASEVTALRLVIP